MATIPTLHRFTQHSMLCVSRHIRMQRASQFCNRTRKQREAFRDGLVVKVREFTPSTDLNHRCSHYHHICEISSHQHVCFCVLKCVYMYLCVCLCLNGDVSSCFLMSACLLDLIKQKTATHIPLLKYDPKQMA